MKQTLIGIIVGLLLGGVAVWTYESRQHKAEGESKKEDEHKEALLVQHGTNGEIFLKLNPQTQARMGLKAQPLESARLNPEVKTYGQVLDPAPLVSLLVEQSTAKASLEASTREYERLKQLAATGQNASARAVEAAEAMMKKDRIQLDASLARLALALGPETAGRTDLASLVESLLHFKAALVRFDVPLTEKLPGRPTGARLASPAEAETFAEAAYLGPATSADPQMPGQGFLFLLQTNPPPPGTLLGGWLTLPGEPESGVIVPREAIVRHEGEAFIYVQKGVDAFARQEVELEHPLKKGWFVEKGLQPGIHVVVEGAQQLLSEEFKGEAEEAE